ncbi:probable C-mannosyltransferase DPY19L1 isoform X3 [Saccostrea echinata]|uniref:probable C-mannosyltransferase DPY19L1 isoform X2 n=1 Tax=Saccostrea echinata TaxID=191078 RepID=UPI002A82991E|nr:probable C-mannosyltransferase DPY19L1 isoform X2 [Saccostrea echinata]XP_061193676.1 probable C-mannosyltransferase DPY19L1 isoform X3 [Saccostrea echinata]
MAAKKRHQNQNSSANTESSNSTRKKTTKRNDSKGERGKSGDVLYKLFIAALAISVGYMHRNHVYGMFERDKHFSHLSNLERELSFRTEMGLYFSYFKTIIEAPSFLDGLNEIMYDNITEYPDTINVLKRFNLYPEVALGIGYRWYDSVMTSLNKPTKMCWTVNRGEGMSPVQSCEGLGEPSYFYVEAVFLLNGFMMSVFFLFGVYLSGSVYGGILTVASFFYNHGECTRVQWTPPLRESFAYPFLIIEMFLVTHTLRMKKPSYLHSIGIAIAVVSFMLPWQFAQFALMTQGVAVFCTYVLGYIGSHKVKVILTGLLSGLLVSYVLLFGNEMLLTSFFLSSLISIIVIVSMEPFLNILKFRVIIWAVQGILLLFGTLGIKYLISKALNVTDDEHIGDIFRSKFSDFNNFHTMLYTCAPEFDFLAAETYWKLLKTILLPSVAVVVIVLAVKLLKLEYNLWRQTCTEEEEEDIVLEGEHRSKPHAEYVYHMFQLAAFTLMAVIIMRLKLFWTPHLCLMTSLLASRKLFGWIGGKEKHYAVVTVLLACMTIEGVQNIMHQWSIMGEYSNYPLEEMVEWIKVQTPKKAVFAGPMPTMATIKLCTGRPIVNHPHYEDAGLRARTMKVYSMFSKKPLSEVKQNLLDLKVDFVILENSWCVRKQKEGCGMAEIWDIEDQKNRHQTVQACTKLRERPEPHFSRVFRNDVYDVLKISKW